MKLNDEFAIIEEITARDFLAIISQVKRIVKFI